MLKVLIWVVSNDGRFFQGAMHILERQHNGVDIIGVTANPPIQLTRNGEKVPFIPLNEIAMGGGYMIFCLSLARDSSAWAKLRTPLVN